MLKVKSNFSQAIRGPQGNLSYRKCELDSCHEINQATLLVATILGFITVLAGRRTRSTTRRREKVSSSRVTPSRARRAAMKTVSLFSGIGGLDLGLEDAGHEIILQVESDPHCIQARPARPPRDRRGFPRPRNKTSSRSRLTPPSSALRARLPRTRHRCSSTTSPAGRCVVTSPSSPSFPPRRSSSPRGSRVRCVQTRLLGTPRKTRAFLGDGAVSDEKGVAFSVFSLTLVSVLGRMSPRSTSRVPACASARKPASARTCSAFCAPPARLGWSWRTSRAYSTGTCATTRRSRPRSATSCRSSSGSGTAGRTASWA